MHSDYSLFLELSRIALRGSTVPFTLPRRSNARLAFRRAFDR
jgi:hypothetical protein